ncbi:uncharacterized protein EKO05_0006296 [Ascochyta rabiei]|uniref:Uncharacterized protein n=1 Tax=Didymella rabiei TaxID=5454 RepID=A0A163AW02_DIDRA|nr:uncharacterized protein EKO05_0006296 [Ascochyta rabiei]KZM21425.1 hypothetical protein ST47_g7332 [Ascochyta rabiei]UPX15860.1 hypothetical protein EKO05_0006296 [Ascochyta rabiei]
MERKRVAIVGSGVSGISALWTLRNAGYEVHLFEAADRLGGHTNTVRWKHNDLETPVDTGFIVLNTATYPNFIQFLNAVNVRTDASEMTFGISRDAGAFEWSGTSLGALFAQSSNAFKLSFWRMIFDIVRFNQFALDLLSIPPGSAAAKEANQESIGQYLEKHGYSDAFRDDYLIPMTACVWSTGADKCALEFPALTLVRFMWNHHLLTTVSERPPWLTVHGGSKNYIDAVMRECKDVHLHLSTQIESIQRKDGRVRLGTGGKAAAKEEFFDSVILACHGDQARSLLGSSATLEESDILDAFETTPNIAYLHSDLSLMPKRRTAWSAWNYLTTTSPTPSAPNPSGTLQTVSLTYNMNILQHIPVSKFDNVLVTLNPEIPPDPALTQAQFEYKHPLYNARMVAAQEELHRIQGKNGVWYAGAWTGYGFHEDGFSSGMKVGLQLGGSVPWEVQDAKFSRGLKPDLNWKDWAVRTVVVVIQLWIMVLERLVGSKKQSLYSNGDGSIDGKTKAT